jgi:hypothetical protein
MTAEQVLKAARGALPSLSRATVYAVLQVLGARGLLKELPIDGAATVYDSNTRRTTTCTTSTPVPSPTCRWRSCRCWACRNRWAAPSWSTCDVIVRVPGPGRDA